MSTEILTDDLLEDERAEVAAMGDYQFGFHDPTDKYAFTSRKGLDHEMVAQISEMKNEPAWMTDFRLRSLEIFEEKPMPTWGGDMSGIDFQNIYYYVRASDKQEKSWDDVPEDIRKTYDRLGIPEAEKKYLSGVKAQYESEVVYGSLQEDLAKQGVIFTDTDSALREHPEMFREYFGTIIPPNDNKFAALNSAVWSGGSFIYVPPGVQIDFPLQAYFRINSENMGQFERTLIIVDEGAECHYVEGCTAPTYSSDSLHSAVVEIVVKTEGRCRYTTIQNWSDNVYNLVTKRAMAYGDSLMEWVDGNLGSKLTMKYPAIYLMEPGARGETLSIAFAGKGQHQDAGAKMVHCAPHTSSRIISKSISQRRRPCQLSRPGEGAEGRDRLQVQRRLRRADPRSRKPQRHLPLHRGRRRRRRDRARSQRLEDRRRATPLPDEPRPERSRSLRDDRHRLHRTARERTADGIRRRNEPPDRTADGRQRGMTHTRSAKPCVECRSSPSKFECRTAIRTP